MTQHVTALHSRWSDIPSEQLNAATARRYLTGDRMTVARFELKRGGVVARHAHENEQVSCVLSGTLKFTVNGQEFLVGEGEVLRIPGGLEHEVEVVEDTIVIDVFSPVRQDWIEKRDDYFRATR
jgi:quercetin dioxygenase-like cupin family protein